MHLKIGEEFDRFNFNTWVDTWVITEIHESDVQVQGVEIQIECTCFESLLLRSCNILNVFVCQRKSKSHTFE